MRRHSGAGDEYSRAVALGVRDDLLCPLGTPVRGGDLHLVRHAHLIECRARLRHDLGIGIAADDDAHPHGVNGSRAQQTGAFASSAGGGTVVRAGLFNGRQLRTNALRAPMSNGFGRNAQIPLSTAVATSGARLALMMMTGIFFRSGSSSRACSTSQPERTGIIRSSTTTFGCSRRIRSSASLPLGASQKTYPSRLSAATIMRRMLGSS